MAQPRGEQGWVVGAWSDPALVPVASLGAADSPRLTGENAAHIRALALSGTPFRPILVRRATMRVVDGMHRLRAAQLRGDQEIAVRFFDGSSAEAFVLSVWMNVQQQGLPLSLADRRAAAARILGSQEHWSDRVIASITGLSHKTVGAIRRRSAGENSQLSSRIGRDGRVRPVDGGERRRRAGELLSRRPEASLREIARAVGVSPATVRDVRDRLRENSPAPPIPADAPDPPNRSPVLDLPEPGAEMVLHVLIRDPSLRFSVAGRTLLRLLEPATVTPRQWAGLIDGIPPHCAAYVATAARRCSRVWLDVAAQIDARHPPDADHPAEGETSRGRPHAQPCGPTQRT